MVMLDANGHEINLAKRGLRVCDWCKLVMSEGYMGTDGSGYACSEECLAADPGWVTEPDEHSEALGLPVLESGMVHITDALIGLWLEDEEADGPTCTVFWTDWEGDDSHEEATERLKSAPYNYTHLEGI